MALGSTGPIEAKVSWPALAATVLTGLVFAANNTDLIPGYDDAPAWVKVIVSIVVVAGGTFGTGVVAPHTFRDDPDALQSGRNRAAAPVDPEPPSHVHRVGEHRVGDRADLEERLHRPDPPV